MSFNSSISVISTLVSPKRSKFHWFIGYRSKWWWNELDNLHTITLIGPVSHRPVPTFRKYWKNLLNPEAHLPQIVDPYWWRLQARRRLVELLNTLLEATNGQNNIIWSNMYWWKLMTWWNFSLKFVRMPRSRCVPSRRWVANGSVHWANSGQKRRLPKHIYRYCRSFNGWWMLSCTWLLLAGLGVIWLSKTCPSMDINPPHPLQWRWPQEQRLLFLEPGASRLVETMCLARPVRDLADSQVQWSIPQAYPRMSKFGRNLSRLALALEEVTCGLRKHQVLSTSKVGLLHLVWIF